MGFGRYGSTNLEASGLAADMDFVHDWKRVAASEQHVEIIGPVPLHLI